MAAMTTVTRSRPLRSVSDTALLVAYHRAMETRRPDALFRDEFAVAVSEGRGEEIARKLRYGRRMAWTTIVRTAVIDQLVARLVPAGVDTVVNLAAGLDARPYRLPLPPSLRWVEVDLPELIREKQEALAAETPRCRLERVAADLSDAASRREVLARVGAESRAALVISEGLLVYLDPAVVGGLADDLRSTSCVRRWIIDLATPMIRKRANRWWGKRLERANTKYQFAPEEGTRFFEPHGWREAEFHELFAEAISLDRTMSGYWMFKAMARLMPRRTERMRALWRSGVVLLARGDAAPAA